MPMRKDQFERPIIILNVTHSGSALLTEILEAHGCWTGNVATDVTNKHPRGHRQNIDLDQYLRCKYNLSSRDKRIAWPMQGVKDFIKSLSPEYPYLFKVNVKYWLAFHEFENPVFILCRRDRDAIIRSQSTNSSMSIDELSQFVDDQIAILNLVEKYCGGLNVSYEKIIQGDYKELYGVVQKCGLLFNPEKVNSLVIPSQQHHKG